MGNAISVFTSSIRVLSTCIQSLFAVLFWNALHLHRSIPEADSTRLLENKRKQLKHILLICLEQDIYENNQIETAIEHMKEIISNIHSITDYNKCEQWLMKYKGDERIILIISNTFGKQIVPHIYHLPSINAIYIYCKNRKSNSKWAQQYSKVYGNIYDFNKIIEQISIDLTDVRVSENERTRSFPHTPTDFTKTIHKQKSFEQNKEVQEGCQTNFQFVLSDLSTRLNEVALAMLKALCLLAKESIVIFDNTSSIDLNKLSNKSTLLFVSSEFATMMKSKPEQIKAIFILEDDKNQVDYREKFATGEDLIFQLADELYQSYKIEAEKFLTSGNTSMAEIREKQADKIHDELKKAYTSSFRKDTVIPTSIDTTTITTIVWLKSKLADESEVENAQNLLSKIVSSFQLFDSEIDCCSYLQKSEECGTVFLIIDTDDESSAAIDSHKFTNVQVVYWYGKGPSENETIIDNYDDLCFQLISDLIAHYNKLGSIYSTNKDAKTAADMFVKVSKLYNILAKL